MGRASRRKRQTRATAKPDASHSNDELVTSPEFVEGTQAESAVSTLLWVRRVMSGRPKVQESPVSATGSCITLSLRPAM